MRCGGGSTTTSSLGCGAVLAGCGALRGEPGPGGSAAASGPATASYILLRTLTRRRRWRHNPAGRWRNRLRLDGAGPWPVRWRQVHRRGQRLRRRRVAAARDNTAAVAAGWRRVRNIGRRARRRIAEDRAEVVAECRRAPGKQRGQNGNTTRLGRCDAPSRSGFRPRPA